MAFSWEKRHSTFEVLLYTNWRTAIEVPDDSPSAKSDGADALDLKLMKPLLEKLLAIHAVGQPVGRLRN